MDGFSADAGSIGKRKRTGMFPGREAISLERDREGQVTQGSRVRGDRGGQEVGESQDVSCLGHRETEGSLSVCGALWCPPPPRLMVPLWHSDLDPLLERPPFRQDILSWGPRALFPFFPSLQGTLVPDLLLSSLPHCG